MHFSVFLYSRRVERARAESGVEDNYQNQSSSFCQRVKKLLKASDSIKIEIYWKAL